VFICYLNEKVELGSSGSIVSEYGLDDRAIGVRTLAGAKDFSSILCVQTGSGSHPASCTMGTGGPFPGGLKRGRGVMLTTHPPHLVPRSWMSRSYTPLPPSASMACRGTALIYFTFRRAGTAWEPSQPKMFLFPAVTCCVSLLFFHVSLSHSFIWRWEGYTERSILLLPPSRGQ
jgi:hypothetical protein